MATYAQTASADGRWRPRARDRDRSVKSLVFLGALWFSLFFGVLVLVVLIVVHRARRRAALRQDLITDYSSTLESRATGFRAGILGIVMADARHRRAVRAARHRRGAHLEEFADRDRWYNRFIEVNLQNLAAVPVRRLRPAGRRLRRRDRDPISAASSSAGRSRCRC